MPDQTSDKIVTVLLDKEDVAKARRFAILRNGGINNEGKGITVTSYVGKTNTTEKLNFVGLLAEIAVAKYFDANIDENIYEVGDGGNPDIDLGSVTLEVRGTQYYPPDLIVSFINKSRATAYVLCLVNPVVNEECTIDIYGCVSRKRFNKEYIIKNYGYGDRYVMEPQNLAPITAIKEYMEKK